MKTIGELKIDEAISLDIVDLSSKQEIFGEKTFMGNIDLIDANYLQTSTRSNGGSSRVYNFSPKNSFIQCEEAFPGSNKNGTYGIACTGYRGFCMLGTDTVAKTVKLSGFLDADTRGQIEWTMMHKDCNCWSYIWGSNDVGDTNGISVVGIVGMDLSSFTVSCNSDAGLPVINSEAEAIETWNAGDENGFYFMPKKVDVEQKMLSSEGGCGTSIIGNAVLASLFANHAEGGSCKAIGKYAHAEGRRCIAEGRYSHAEGSFCHARRIYCHAEGNMTFANGTASHVEGYNSQALGNYTHAAGYYACAEHPRSFVWSGIEGTTLRKSNANGSFNIYPQNGLSGFFIGNNNFTQCVLAAVQSMDDNQKAALRTALGV